MRVVISLAPAASRRLRRYASCSSPDRLTSKPTFPRVLVTPATGLPPGTAKCRGCHQVRRTTVESACTYRRIGLHEADDKKSGGDMRRNFLLIAALLIVGVA